MKYINLYEELNKIGIPYSKDNIDYVLVAIKKMKLTDELKNAYWNSCLILKIKTNIFHF